jgi:predicted PurR-regulated permease PerM
MQRPAALPGEGPGENPVRSRSDAEPGQGRLTTTYVELAIRLGVLGLLLYWSVTLLLPFSPILVWSVVIAVALYPLHQRAERTLGGRTKLAATLVTAGTLLVVVGPATWLTLDLIENARTLSEQVDWHDLSVPAPSAAVKAWPVVGPEIYRIWDFAHANTRDALVKIYPYLKPLGSSLVQFAAGAGAGVVKFLVSIIVAGFLFVYAPTLVEAINRLARKLEAERGEQFVALAASTIRIVSRGVVGVAALQALLAGIGLMVAQVPAASLIALAILVLGIVQIGASIVILPLVVWSWFSMDTTPALLFTLYMIPVSLIDNVLRPFLLGYGLRIPTLVILIGVIGGTLSYGMTGLFLGPIVLAVIWEVLVAWIGLDQSDAHASGAA